MAAVKAAVRLIIAIVFVVGTVCATACPDIVAFQSHCHPEKSGSETPSRETGANCLQSDELLSQKNFSDGFVLPAATVTSPLSEPAEPIAPLVDAPRLSTRILRSVILRI